MNQEFVALLLNQEEQGHLEDICHAFGIRIPYPELFRDGNYHPMWGISPTGIGLIGTKVLSVTKVVLRGEKELLAYLKN